MAIRILTMPFTIPVTAPFNVANHSGAIIVGAGAAPTAYGGSDVDRSRLDFSNYGSRVDLQGWGEAVVTTGYGDLYNEHPDSNWDYTNSFSGTLQRRTNSSLGL